jgi:hypothetical protein
MISYIPGVLSTSPGPLARYLPPVPEGVISAWLVQHAPPGAWVLDPFGASPRMVCEAARAGYRVLVAANNPIDRFLLELIANPPSEAELRSSLADLATAVKGDSRIEPLLRGLYMTPCAHCQHEISPEAFIWERGATAPNRRIYHCPNCGETGEFPITQADEIKLSQLPSSHLHYSRALERVTPFDDPDRALVQEALDVYLPRAIYALFTLINKLDSLPAQRRRPLSALLLAAFDQGNTLWHYPAQRARPRQLSTPAHFRENNIWLAMEEAIEAWTHSFSSGSIDNSNFEPLSVTSWPGALPERGGICLFEGRLKDLAETWQAPRNLTQENPQLQGAIVALPRPNQAYWTLSALWSGWLWGPEAAVRFKTVLHRRRYDWNWHCAALFAAFTNLARILHRKVSVFGLVGEAEPGFLSAVQLSAAMAGFQLNGVALRQSDSQAQMEWQLAGAQLHTETPDTAINIQSRIKELTQQAGLDYLRQRGEPANYLQIHAAALASLVGSGMIRQDLLLGAGQSEESSPAEILSQVQNNFQQAFSYRNGFVRFHGSPNSLEVGQWWLRESKYPAKDLAEDTLKTPASQVTATEDIEIPLADRVEMEIVRLLLRKGHLTMGELDQHMTTSFPGLFTPDIELIQVCLESYAEQDPPEHGPWRLRPQEAPHMRRSDLAAISNLLRDLGTRLGFLVSQPDSGPRWTTWSNPNHEIRYAFYPLASAVIGNIVTASVYPPQHCLILYPGSRTSLLRYKLRQDPRLQTYVETGWRFLKFRLLRRLAESDSLDRQSLDDQLALDPMASQDPQIAFF